MPDLEHPAVTATPTAPPKARPASARVRIAGIWARRLHGPTGTAMFFLKRMKQDEVSGTAAALCYWTAFGLVPAFAVIFAIMSAFPAFSRLRIAAQDAITANLLPDTGLKIQEALNSFVAAATGTLTAFGIVGLAITAISLLVNIEGAFNRIFRVMHPRSILMRLVVFWAVLSIAPFMIVMSVSLFGYFSNIAGQTKGPLATILFGHVLPTLVSWALIAFLYRGVPNRPVRMRDAAIGAALTAVLLEVLRVGFAYYVKGSTYSAIYGAVAAVPVFLVWIYALWMAVMAGAVIAAALPDWRLLRAGHGSGPGLKLAVALAILDRLLIAFRGGDELSPDTIGEAVAVPPAGVLPVLEELRRAHYVAVTESGCWVLARNLSETPFVDLVHRFGLGVGPAVLELRGTPLGERVCPYLEPAAASERDMLKVCLDELLTRHSAEKKTAP